MLKFKGRKSDVLITNEPFMMDEISHLSMEVLGAVAFGASWEEFFRSSKLASLNKQSFLLLMITEVSERPEEYSSVMSLIARNGYLKEAAQHALEQGIPRDDFMGVLLYAAYENKTVAHALAKTKRLDDILKVAELYQFKPKHLLDLVTRADNDSTRPIANESSEFYLELFKICKLNNHQIVDFLTKKHDSPRNKKNEGMWNEEDERPLVHCLINRGGLSKVLLSDDLKMTSAQVIKLLETTDFEGNNGMHLYSYADLTGPKNAYRWLDPVLLKYNLPEEDLIRLLFSKNNKDQTSLHITERVERIDFLHDFFSKSRLKPETILKIMSHLSADPLDVEPIISPRTKGKTFILNLSFLAASLLKAKEDSHKVITNVEKLINQEPDIHPNWIKMFEMMKRIHHKQGGLTTPARSLLQSPVTLHQPSNHGRRLEKYVA
jgi:hypothetical protein